MRSLVKKSIFLIITAIIIASMIWLFFALIPESPLSELESAQEAIAKARDHNSVIYSGKTFREARSYYDSAMISWKTENKRFILFRDYERARMFASISQKKAAEATKTTISKANDMRLNLDSEIKRLTVRIKDFERLFSSVPVPQEIKKKHAKGKLLLKEAVIAFNKGEYVTGSVKIAEANEYLTDSYAFANDKLTAYYKNYSRWQEWAAKTIRESRERGSYAIVVEKIPGVCYLYHRGEKKYTFEVEFGKNWMGDKVSKGDNATPEGRYKITKKLSNGATKYHKALLINYPNEQDLEEFRVMVQSGKLPSGTKIGGLIEIHGEGGRGGNWTEGCVALRNSDMDVLFKYAGHGTPVTIIGSSVPLSEFMSSR